MSSLFLRRCFCSIVVLCGLPSVVLAQTPAGDAARGQGAYLNGAGWYNLNTAKANSVNTDAAIRWKQDLRKIQTEKRDLEARTAAGKKLRAEDVKQRQFERERQLRVAPTGADVQTGEALNVLLFDLTDPAITTEDWQSKSIALPERMSVKDLIFRFTPLSGSSTSSAALSKGVIALSRLAVTGEAWPTPLQLPEVERERLAYESAYAKVQGEIREGEFDIKSVQEMDKSLDALKAKVNSAVPVERGFRTEAGKFVEDLKNSTKMFDAATIDYAREILVDTKDHEATTVAELVAFMLKYRLQFASAERSPDASELYIKLHEALRQQHTAFGIKLPEIPIEKEVIGPFLTNSVWVSDDQQQVLTVAERTADTFRAMFEHGGGKGLKRDVKGEIKDNKFSWLAKDVRVIKGAAGGDNHGTIGRDEKGDKIDFVWRSENGGSGTFTLRLRK